MILIWYITIQFSNILFHLIIYAPHLFPRDNLKILQKWNILSKARELQQTLQVHVEERNIHEGVIHDNEGVLPGLGSHNLETWVFWFLFLDLMLRIWCWILSLILVLPHSPLFGLAGVQLPLCGLLPATRLRICLLLHLLSLYAFLYFPWAFPPGQNLLISGPEIFFANKLFKISDYGFNVT